MSYLITFEAAGWRDWHQWFTDGLPHTIHGTVKITTIAIPYLHQHRRLWLRLPSSYFHTDRAYPLLIMLDGANLFDGPTSYSKTEWQVDETLLKLEHEGLEAVVLGIDNAPGNRHREYVPWRHDTLAPAFIALLVETILPRVRACCRILPGRAQTFIGGSSLGGCCALWAFLAYPKSFGGCASFSPAMHNGLLVQNLRRHSYTPARVYLDHGDIHGSDDFCDSLPLYQMLCRKGYRYGIDLLYNPIEHPSQPHHESAWAFRFPTAARFLLTPSLHVDAP